MPKAETFFVTGYVKNGGPFLHDATMTVSKAISMAGGVSEKGSRSRVRITRLVDGKQVVVKDVKLEDRCCRAIPSKSCPVSGSSLSSKGVWHRTAHTIWSSAQIPTNARRARRERPSLRRHRADARDDGAGAGGDAGGCGDVRRGGAGPTRGRASRLRRRRACAWRRPPQPARLGHAGAVQASPSDGRRPAGRSGLSRALVVRVFRARRAPPASAAGVLAARSSGGPLARRALGGAHDGRPRDLQQLVDVADRCRAAAGSAADRHPPSGDGPAVSNGRARRAPAGSWNRPGRCRHPERQPARTVEGSLQPRARAWTPARRRSCGRCGSPAPRSARTSTGTWRICGRRWRASGSSRACAFSASGVTCRC